MKNGRWRQDIYQREEKMKIGLGCGGHRDCCQLS